VNKVSKAPKNIMHNENMNFFDLEIFFLLLNKDSFIISLFSLSIT
jgi:hypothetical protein